ncbi:SLC2A13 [Acanthosepion pharaonis]|uniref:SLC2A13 n=1 Tax=Acanthosepion pharaonis TaxID=158019 RepID=A0A812B2G0_ACAPH|nr:SLC2A13 [Sepia pharaonis]
MPSAAIGSLIGAYLSDSFGRRKCLMFACFCYMLGSVVSGSAYNRETLLTGRLMTGCGIGIACAATAVYVAECSPSHLRGRLIGLSQPFLNIGILIAMIISAVFSYDKKNGWRYIWGIQGIFSCIQFTALIFLPESPRWLLQKSCKDEAKETLTRIRNTKDVEQEMQTIEVNFKEIQKSIEKSGGGNLFLRMLKTSSVRRALVVGCGLHLFAQFSGVNTVIYYSGIIIQMSGVGNVSSALWNSVIVNCVSLTFAIIGMWLVDSAGRRKLAIIGLLGLFFSSLCLGTTFLMAARYSPSVNTTNDFPNNTCSTYRKWGRKFESGCQCDDCVRDANCGFCHEDIRAVINGACLPVSDTSHLISESGSCNSSLTLSKYSMKWAYNYCPVTFSWIAIVGFALFLIFNAPNVITRHSVNRRQRMGPLPWTLNAEIYPLWARSTGNALGAMTAWICNLIIAASFLSFIELIQSYGVFYVMASVALIGSVFCFFFLPETKNKSLEEIEILFSPKKPNV